MRIVGSFVSPYVRKVLVCCELKGIAYEVDPITPFFGGDEFERLSPLRRIPVLVDGDFHLSDSSVICDYLDHAYPGVPLLPADPRARARGLWFEEFADSRLGDLFIWSLFYQRVVRPMVWNEPCDERRVEQALSSAIPAALDYLEREAPDGGFLLGGISLADIAVASFFRNAAYAGFEPDPGRWPKVARWVAETLATGPFAKLLAFEDIQRGASIASRRQALLDAGAPLAAETLGTREARRGVMPL